MSNVYRAMAWLFLAAAIVGCAGPTVQTMKGARDSSAAFIGCWQGDGAQPFLLRCEPTRISWFDPREGEPRFLLVKYEEGRIVAFMGRWFPLPWEFKGDALAVGEATLHRIGGIPEKLLLAPAQLGTEETVPADALPAIKEELQARFQADQAVRSNPLSSILPAAGDKGQKMHEVDAANTKYLRKVIAQYGWIDTRRFGATASLAAWAIVQHSGDTPLLLAVLPEVKKELGKAGPLAAMQYALLYDRTMLMTGQKQRYGTQSVCIRAEGTNDKEETFTWPIEDPARVDAYWEEIGGK